MRIIIGGALGHMGRELAQAAQAAGVTIACGVDVAYQGQPSAFPVVAGFDKADAEADVLIDFSRPEALYDLLGLIERKKMPAVLCATGYTEEEIARVREVSGCAPILRSANMSLGVNVLCRLAAMARKALGDGYDVEIVERHHRRKLDSPSGTALMLFNAVNREAGSVMEPVYGRYGRTEKRAAHEIGIHAVRGGTMAGEHEVCFLGNGEELLLQHRAENRSLFAEGALKAAGFLVGKPAGLYSMQDVVDAIIR